MSCNFNTVQFLFRSHQAELLIADRWPCMHLAIFMKFSSHLHSKNLTFSSSTNITFLTSFLVLGITFSYSTKLFVLK